MLSKSICCRLASNLQELLDGVDIDSGHGIKHALAVLNHAENALTVSPTPKLEYQRNAVLYAALLHDADDSKLFPFSENNENARRILETVLPGEKTTHDLVIRMIDLVSCSKNGNSTGNLKKDEMWMLIPRMADRLEASGAIGIVRAWIYTEHIKRPLWLDSTPRALTIEDIGLISTSERFDSYLVKKESDSMIDHFYDKVLHITSPEAVNPLNNPYLTKEAHERHKYVVKFILRFGQTGKIDRRTYNKIRVQASAKATKSMCV